MLRAARGAVTGDRADGGGGGGGGGALVERVGAVCDAFGRSMEAHNLRCRDLKCCTRTALGRGDDVQTLAISTVIVAGASGVELKRVALKVGKLCSGKFGLLKNLVPVRAVAEALVAGELPCTPPDAQAAGEASIQTRCMRHDSRQRARVRELLAER